MDSQREGPDSNPGGSIWVFFVDKVAPGRFLTKYFSVHLSVSVHKYPILIHSSITENIQLSN